MSDEVKATPTLVMQLDVTCPECGTEFDAFEESENDEGALYDQVLKGDDVSNRIKKGDIVVMADCFESSHPRYAGKLLEVVSEPRSMGNTEVVTLNFWATGKRANNAFATCFLIPIDISSIRTSQSYLTGDVEIAE